MVLGNMNLRQTEKTERGKRKGERERETLTKGSKMLSGEHNWPVL